MLDLNFVRDNLPRVEEMLRQRGADPGAVLKDFHEVDTQRRQAITEAETMKARRNKASEDIYKLKKSGRMLLRRSPRRKPAGGDSGAGENASDLNTRLQDILAGIPNMPHSSVPVGLSAEDNVEVRRWGAPPQFDLLRSRIGIWARNSECSISNARSSLLARASPFTGISGRSSNARWRTSCSICIRANMETPKCCRRTS